MNEHIAKKILIVEDSPIQAQALQTLLGNYDVRIRCAPNGAQGIAITEEWLPDVVVLDIKMPKMDGFEVFRQLRNNPKTDHIPIVMMTRYNEPAALKMGIYLGAVDFIPKDEFANAVLVRTLQQLEVVQEMPGTDDADNS